MEREHINEISQLITKFKAFLFCTIKDNDKLEDDKKDKIQLLLDKFITNDVYQFKAIVNLLIKNKEQFLSQMSIKENQFNDNKQKKYHEFIELFKTIYGL